MKSNFITSTVSAQPVEHVDNVVPGFIRTEYPEFIEFLDHYFQYLNKDLNKPSKTITELLSSREIDSLAEQFLEMIGFEIAHNWPKSQKMDRRTLLKRIVELNKIKGNFSSFDAFFQIFFRKKACYYEPSQDLFTLSSDKHLYDWSRDLAVDYYNDYAPDLSAESGQRFTKRWKEGDLLPSSSGDGHISSTKKLHDGIFYQRFSYSIALEERFAEWRETFLELLHPAGARMFAQSLLVSRLTLKYVAEHMNGLVFRLNLDLVFILERALLKYEAQADPSKYYWELYAGQIIYSYTTYLVGWYNINDPTLGIFDEDGSLLFGNYPIPAIDFGFANYMPSQYFIQSNTSPDFTDGVILFQNPAVSPSYDYAEIEIPSEWFQTGFVNPYARRYFNLPQIFRDPRNIWKVSIESTGNSQLNFEGADGTFDPDLDAEYSISNERTYNIYGWFSEKGSTDDILPNLHGTVVNITRANLDEEKITFTPTEIISEVNGNYQTLPNTGNYTLFDAIYKYGVVLNQSPFTDDYQSDILFFNSNFNLPEIQFNDSPFVSYGASFEHGEQNCIEPKDYT